MVFMIIIPFWNGYFIGNRPNIFRQTTISYHITSYYIIHLELPHPSGGFPKVHLARHCPWCYQHRGRGRTLAMATLLRDPKISQILAHYHGLSWWKCFFGTSIMSTNFRWIQLSWKLETLIHTRMIHCSNAQGVPMSLTRFEWPQLKKENNGETWLMDSSSMRRFVLTPSWIEFSGCNIVRIIPVLIPIFIARSCIPLHLTSVHTSMYTVEREREGYVHDTMCVCVLLVSCTHTRWLYLHLHHFIYVIYVGNGRCTALVTIENNEKIHPSMRKSPLKHGSLVMSPCFTSPNH